MNSMISSRLQIATYIRPCILACLLCMQRGGQAFCPTKRVGMATWSGATAASSHLQYSSVSYYTMPNHEPPPHHPSSKTRRISHVHRSDSSIVSYASTNTEQPLSSSSSFSSSSPRSKLRQITGFSLTALRSTLRAVTGLSLTTLRVTLRAATGMSLSTFISETNRRVFDVLSPSLRYFLQPFLIAYYAPLLLIRYWMVGPSRQYVEDSQSGHERIVEGWRRAVEAAEKANADGYWPVHLNEDGTITTSMPRDGNSIFDLADGIEKSVAAYN